MFRYEMIAVNKGYGRRKILRDFGLAIVTGEMLAITGPSGAGKSTLLNILGLFDRVDSGTVLAQGKPVPRPNSGAARGYIRDHVGYLFQNYALVESDTVRANLALALTYSKSPVPKARQIEEALAFVGLPQAAGRRVFTLSGGEQQRVAVARLMLKPCDIVLADEPTAALDSENRDIVLALLKELNSTGKTVVIATHDEKVAVACSRQVALRSSAPLPE